MPKVITKLCTPDLGLISKTTFEFLILTALRTDEVISARWNEIDFKEQLWTAPAERIKAGRVHRVPLSDRVVELSE